MPAEATALGGAEVIGKHVDVGRRGYDLRQAMEQRLDRLNSIARP